MVPKDADGSKRCVVLKGLTSKTTPLESREAFNIQIVGTFPDDKIVDLIERAAVILHRHTKNSRLIRSYCGKVPSGRSTLSYLLSFVHVEPVAASNSETGGDRKLKQLARAPLGNWDNVYYAMQADIREIYARLKKDVGLDTSAAQFIIHTAGPLGRTDQTPFSALEFAFQLETMWDILHDPHLVARLDQAIRIKVIKSSTNLQFVEGTDSPLLRLAGSLSPRRGLCNTHKASAQRITSMLNKKIDDQFHVEAEKTQPNREPPKMIAAARVDVRNMAAAARARKARKVTIACLCQEGCHCQVELDCGMQRGECPCAYARHEICDLIGLQREVHDSVQSHAHAVGVVIPEPSTILSADTNEAARMQVAGLATADPYIVQMCKHTAEETAKRDEQNLALHRSRSRADARDIDLAYVPAPQTSGRVTKDPFPLAFYSNSPHRYPKMSTGAVPDAVKAFDTAQVPYPQAVHTSSFEGRALTYGEVNPPSVAVDRVSQSTGVTYPTIPASQSSDSFYNHNNEMTPHQQYDVDVDVSASEYSELANMARHQVNPFKEMVRDPSVQYASPEPMDPSALAARADQYQSNQYAPRPAVRAQTVSDGSPYNGRMPGVQQKVRSEPHSSKPHPPLPPGACEPSFDNHTSPVNGSQGAPLHAPLRQRWVQAGGNAKLSERPEIDGPPLKFNRAPTGTTMSAAAVFERLNDADVIEHTMQRTDASTHKHSRNSAEHSNSDPMTPQPRSSPTYGAGDKRGRQDSMGSSSGRGRMAKLKRVFSRSGNSP
nr:hypothetical protein CFP56_63940 [Quercus suber]